MKPDSGSVTPEGRGGKGKPDTSPGWAWRAAGRIVRDPARGPVGTRLMGWLMNALVVRHDCHLSYFCASDKSVRPYTATRESVRKHGGTIRDDEPVLTSWELARHLGRKEGPSGCIGTHLLNTSGFGRCVAADIDAHGEQTADILARNEGYALHLDRKLAALGLRPLALDYGCGSYHVWVPFGRFVRADVLYHFGRWIVADAVEHGFGGPVESFPKRDTGGGFGGGALRLPGLHPKRQVWPRVWDGGRWVEEQAAVDHILSVGGADPDRFIPHAIFEECAGRAKQSPIATPPTNPAPRFAVNPTGPATDDLPGADFSRRGDWAETGLFEAGWTRGGGNAVIRPGKSGGISGTLDHCTSTANGWPLFHCFTAAGTPFEQGDSYNRFQVFAIVKHGGDFSAAAKALRAMGYGGRVDRERSTQSPPPDFDSFPFDIDAHVREPDPARDRSAQGHGASPTANAGTPHSVPPPSPPASTCEPPSDPGTPAEPLEARSIAPGQGAGPAEINTCTSDDTLSVFRECLHPKKKKTLAKNRKRAHRPVTPPSGPVGTSSPPHLLIPWGLHAEAQTVWCTAGARRAGAGVGRRNRGEQAILKPTCQVMSCIACHVFRRLGYLHPLCGHLAAGWVSLTTPPFRTRFRLWRGGKGAYKSLLEHLGYVAKVTRTPRPAVVWTHARPGGPMTVVFVGGPDPDPSLRQVPKGETAPPPPAWGRSPVEVSPEEAADAIAVAVKALPRRVYPGQNFRPFYVTTGLFPDVPEPVGEERDRALVTPYTLDGQPVVPRVTGAAIVEAAAACGLTRISAAPDSAGVGVGESVVYLLSAYYDAGGGTEVAADFWDRVAGEHPPGAPPRLPEECRRYHPAGWRPPKRPRKLRPVKPVWASFDRLLVRMPLPPWAGGSLPKTVIAVARLAATFVGDGWDAEIAAIRAVSGTRGGLARAFAMARSLLLECGFDPDGWLPLPDAGLSGDGDGASLSAGPSPGPSGEVLSLGFRQPSLSFADTPLSAEPARPEIAAPQPDGATPPELCPAEPPAPVLPAVPPTPGPTAQAVGDSRSDPSAPTPRRAGRGFDALVAEVRRLAGDMMPGTRRWAEKVISRCDPAEIDRLLRTLRRIASTGPPDRGAG